MSIQNKASEREDGFSLFAYDYAGQISAGWRIIINLTEFEIGK